MIDINTLKITGKVLVIDASVSSLSYFDNVLIKEIEVYTHKGFSTSGGTPITTISVMARTYSGTLTEAELGYSLKDNMFIFKFIADGTPSSDTPCGMDTMYKYSAVFDGCNVFNAIVNYSKELDNSCEIPKDLMDTMLQYYAVKYAVNGGYIEKAVELYRKFFEHASTLLKIKSCGCYGR